MNNRIENTMEILTNLIKNEDHEANWFEDMLHYGIEIYSDLEEYIRDYDASDADLKNGKYLIEATDLRDVLTTIKYVDIDEDNLSGVLINTGEDKISFIESDNLTAYFVTSIDGSYHLQCFADREEAIKYLINDINADVEYKLISAEEADKAIRLLKE